MSLRNLLETNFPLGTTEKRITVSTEGFFDKIKEAFKNKKSKGQTPREEGDRMSPFDYDSFAAKFARMKIDSIVLLPSDEIKLSKRSSATFTRNKKQVNDIIAEIKSDHQQLIRILGIVKPGVKNYCKFIKKAEKEVEAFDRQYPGMDHFDELVALIDKLNKEAPERLSKKAPKLSKPLLGESTFFLIPDDEWDTTFIIDDVGPLTVKAPTKQELSELQKIINKNTDILMALLDLDDFRYGAMDITDQPWGRYANKFLKDDRYADKINTSVLFEPHDEDSFYGIIDTLQEIVFQIGVALGEYVYKSIKNDQ